MSKILDDLEAGLDNKSENPWTLAQAEPEIRKLIVYVRAAERWRTLALPEIHPDNLGLAYRMWDEYEQARERLGWK